MKNRLHDERPTGTCNAETTPLFVFFPFFSLVLSQLSRFLFVLIFKRKGLKDFIFAPLNFSFLLETYFLLQNTQSQTQGKVLTEYKREGGRII